jgi:hypothetical protein
MHESFNSNAVATLIVQGVLDSICAGVLIYVSSPNSIAASCSAESCVLRAPASDVGRGSHCQAGVT